MILAYVMNFESLLCQNLDDLIMEYFKFKVNLLNFEYDNT